VVSVGPVCMLDRRPLQFDTLTFWCILSQSTQRRMLCRVLRKRKASTVRRPNSSAGYSPVDAGVFATTSYNTFMLQQRRGALRLCFLFGAWPDSSAKHAQGGLRVSLLQVPRDVWQPHDPSLGIQAQVSDHWHLVPCRLLQPTCTNADCLCSATQYKEGSMSHK